MTCNREFNSLGHRCTRERGHAGPCQEDRRQAAIDQSLRTVDLRGVDLGGADLYAPRKCRDCDASLAGIRGLCLEHRAQAAEQALKALKRVEQCLARQVDEDGDFEPYDVAGALQAAQDGIAQVESSR